MTDSPDLHVHWSSFTCLFTRGEYICISRRLHEIALGNRVYHLTTDSLHWGGRIFVFVISTNYSLLSLTHSLKVSLTKQLLTNCLSDLNIIFVFSSPTSLSSLSSWVTTFPWQFNSQLWSRKEIKNLLLSFSLFPCSTSTVILLSYYITNYCSRESSFSLNLLFSAGHQKHMKSALESNEGNQKETRSLL